MSWDLDEPVAQPQNVTRDAAVLGTEYVKRIFWMDKINQALTILSQFDRYGRNVPLEGVKEPV